MTIKIINTDEKGKGSFTLHDLIKLRQVEDTDAFVGSDDKLYLITRSHVICVCNGVIFDYKDTIFTVKYFCDLEIRTIPK